MHSTLSAEYEKPLYYYLDDTTMALLLDTFSLHIATLLSLNAVFSLCAPFSLPHSFSLQGQHASKTTNWWWVSGELLQMTCAVSLHVCACASVCLCCLHQ